MTAEAIQAWPVTAFEALALEHFALIAALQPELVVFGTGPRLRFPRPEWVRPLLDARIGIESMDTRAACRTYNVLMSEGRRVAAAVLAP